MRSPTLHSHTLPIPPSTSSFTFFSSFTLLTFIILITLAVVLYHQWIQKHQHKSITKVFTEWTTPIQPQITRKIVTTNTQETVTTDTTTPREEYDENGVIPTTTTITPTSTTPRIDDISSLDARIRQYVKREHVLYHELHQLRRDYRTLRHTLDITRAQKQRMIIVMEKEMVEEQKQALAKERKEDLEWAWNEQQEAEEKLASMEMEDATLPIMDVQMEEEEEEKHEELTFDKDAMKQLSRQQLERWIQRLLAQQQQQSQPSTSTSTSTRHPKSRTRRRKSSSTHKQRKFGVDESSDEDIVNNLFFQRHQTQTSHPVRPSSSLSSLDSYRRRHSTSDRNVKTNYRSRSSSLSTSTSHTPRLTLSTIHSSRVLRSYQNELENEVTTHRQHDTCHDDIDQQDIRDPDPEAPMAISTITSTTNATDEDLDRSLVSV